MAQQPTLRVKNESVHNCFLHPTQKLTISMVKENLKNMGYNTHRLMRHLQNGRRRYKQNQGRSGPPFSQSNFIETDQFCGGLVNTAHQWYFMHQSINQSIVSGMKFILKLSSLKPQAIQHRAVKWQTSVLPALGTS